MEKAQHFCLKRAPVAHPLHKGKALLSAIQGHHHPCVQHTIPALLPAAGVGCGRRWIPMLGCLGQGTCFVCCGDQAAHPAPGPFLLIAEDGRFPLQVHHARTCASSPSRYWAARMPQQAGDSVGWTSVTLQRGHARHGRAQAVHVSSMPWAGTGGDRLWGPLCCASSKGLFPSSSIPAENRGQPQADGFSAANQGIAALQGP